MLLLYSKLFQDLKIKPLNREAIQCVCVWGTFRQIFLTVICRYMGSFIYLIDYRITKTCYNISSKNNLLQCYYLFKETIPKCQDLSNNNSIDFVFHLTYICMPNLRQNIM